jgi:hypothetical protein
VNVHDLVLFGHLLSLEKIILVVTRKGKIKINKLFAQGNPQRLNVLIN